LKQKHLAEVTIFKELVGGGMLFWNTLSYC